MVRMRDGGLNVYLAEIENIIAKYPQVAEVAVVGLPHAKWGEGVAAVVITRQGQTVVESDLIQFCKENLADYKVPKAVIIKTEFPRSAAGKTLKRVIQEKHKDLFISQ